MGLLQQLSHCSSSYSIFFYPLDQILFCFFSFYFKSFVLLQWFTNCMGMLMLVPTFNATIWRAFSSIMARKKQNGEENVEEGMKKDEMEIQRRENVSFCLTLKSAKFKGHFFWIASQILSSIRYLISVLLQHVQNILEWSAEVYLPRILICVPLRSAVFPHF